MVEKRILIIKDKNLHIPDDCKTIMIKNYPTEYTEESLADWFRKFGKILNVRIVNTDLKRLGKE